MGGKPAWAVLTTAMPGNSAAKRDIKCAFSAPPPQTNNSLT
jgi:hypothetical protein